MKIAIVTDSKQADLLVASAMELDHVFSFCPEATYALKKAGYRTHSSADYYGSLSHAKTAVAITRMLDPLTQAATKAYALGSAIVSGFRANLLYELSTMYYVYYSTRHYRQVECIIYTVSKTDIVSHATYESAFSALMDRVLRRYNHSYENMEYSSLNRDIARVCNRVIWWASGARRAVRVVHFGESALALVEQALAQQARTVVFKPRTIGRTIAQTLFVTLCDLWALIHGKAGRLHYFRHTAAADYAGDFSQQTDEFARAVAALILRFPLPEFEQRIVENSGWYLPFLRAQEQVGKNVVKDIAPHLVMTNKGKYHFIRAAVAALAPGRGVGMLINHGTHTAQPAGTISQVAANLWGGDDRIYFSGAKYVVLRLPSTVEQLKQIYSPPFPEFVVLPTIKKITRHYADPQQRMKIVFAGNYMGTMIHMPWCVETPEEYLRNILRLIETIGTMDRVEFIIKLKARKASAHIAVLQERIEQLGLQHKVRIDTQTKFLDLLADTHLLVSNLSTTIEEALVNRVPVLLHTYRRHYFHLPCAFDVAQDRPPGYVYGVKPGQDLQALVEAIRVNYPRVVADEAALGGVVWKEPQFNDLQALAARITSLAAV